jgi:hypothetical protein
MISTQEWLDNSKYAEFRKDYYSVVLNCGHLPADPSIIYDSGLAATTGYGTDQQGRKYCFACCAEHDKAQMKQHGAIDLYLSERGNQLVVSTWPGKIISQRVKTINSWRNNFGDRRIAVRFCFEGEIWSGQGSGVGMILRCRRTKYRNMEGEK